jgi:hypothetical protein
MPMSMGLQISLTGENRYGAVVSPDNELLWDDAAQMAWDDDNFIAWDS